MSEERIFNEENNETETPKRPELMLRTGEFVATLKSIRNMDEEKLTAEFRQADGTCFLAMAWKNSRYLELNRIPIGTSVRLIFARSRKGNVYLRDVVILEPWKEEPDLVPEKKEEATAVPMEETAPAGPRKPQYRIPNRFWAYARRPFSLDEIVGAEETEQSLTEWEQEEVLCGTT